MLFSLTVSEGSSSLRGCGPVSRAGFQLENTHARIHTQTQVIHEGHQRSMYGQLRISESQVCSLLPSITVQVCDT